MKKYLYQIMVAFLAISTFTLTSCGDDDDSLSSSDGYQTIEINNTQYSLSTIAGFDGSWDEDQKGGGFGICVNVEHKGLTDVEYYLFDYKNRTCPEVGDDFGNMDLTLRTLTHDNDYSWDLYDPYHYQSGTAVVTATSPDDSKITIRFKNLKMANSSNTYTFNGTVTLPFSYDNW